MINHIHPHTYRPLAQLERLVVFMAAWLKARNADRNAFHEDHKQKHLGLTIEYFTGVAGAFLLEYKDISFWSVFVA